MRIQDMDIVVPNQLDERRIEVLADGLPLFHGAQVAGRDGAPRLRCADVDGALLEAARQRKSSGILSRQGVGGKVVSGDCTLPLALFQSQGPP